MNTRTIGMLAMLATLLFAGALGAQANERIRFQARLTDSGGTAIIVGTNVTFNLYTSPTGGTPVWTETATIVPNNNGVFTTELGATTAFTGVDFSQVLYLGITVDTDPEMTPRYLMTAQALSHYARNAGLLDGLDSSAFAQLGAASSTFTGDITAASFTGDGSGLTSLSSSALTGPLPSLDGSALTNLNASAITSGTLSDARLTPNIPLLNAANNTFTGTVAAAQLTAPLVNATTVSGTTVSGTTISGSTIIATVTGQFPTLTTTSLATLQSLQVNTTANITGALTAGSLSGNGAGVTNVDAALLGGLARTGFAELTGATFTGGVTATTFTGNGAALTNVNALTLLGNNWASPAAIGATTPNTGAFTTLSSSGLSTLNSLTVTGAAGTDTLNVASTSSLTGAVTLGNDAATPVAGTVAIHDDQAANTFTGTMRVLTGGLTANRTYSLPDNTGTLALLSDITGGGSTGSFTTLSSSGLATLNSLSVTNNAGVGGALTVTGSATAASFSGDGSALTALNATALTSGTVPAARLTGSYGIDITGNAASASSVPAAGITGTITDAQVTNDLTINTTSAITGSNGLTITSGGITVTGGSFSGDLIGNVTGNVSGTASGFTGNLAGDVTGPQGSTLIANNAVTSAKILDGTITGTDLDAAIGITTTGGITAASFTGDGSALTALNATALTSGTVPAARLSGSYGIDITGNAATATSATTAATASSVPAAGITGTIGYGQLNLAGSIVGSDLASNIGITTTSGITAASFSGDGSALTALNATALTSGTVDAARLSGTYAIDISGNAATATSATSASSVPAAGIVGTIGYGQLNLASSILGSDLAANIAINTTGGITAASFTGNGSALTNVDASTLGGLARAGFAELTGATFTGGVSAPAVTVTSTALTTDLQYSATPGALAADFTGASFLTTVATAGANLVRGTQFSVQSGGTAETQGVSVGTEHTAVIASPGALAGMPDVVGLYAETRNTNATSTTLSIGMMGSADNPQAGVNVGVVGSASASTYQSFGMFGMANADRADVENFSDAFTGQSAALLLLNTQAAAGNYGLYVEAANNLIDGSLTVTGAINASITGTAADSLLLGGQNGAFYLSRANHTGNLPDAALTGTYTGAVSFSNAGAITATSFTGNGAGVTNVDAAQLGGLARTGFAELTGANFTGGVTATTFTGNGAALTNLDAGALASGTVPAGRLTGSYGISITGNAATATTASSVPAAGITGTVGYSQLNLSGSILGSDLDAGININTTGTVTAASFSGSGAGLTGVTAASVAAGNVTDGNLTLATGNLTLTGGTLTVAGNTSSFTAPLATPGATYTAHDFVSSVDANAGNTSRTLRALMTGTNAGTAEVTGAWLEAIGDGDITQGTFGQAVYTGGLGGGTAIGVDGRARSFIGGQALLAIGTAGRADDAQLGSNIGVHAWAANGGKSAGIFAVANATQAQQQAFDGTLAAGTTAAILGYNNQGGANDFGLHVTAANNRIDGNLTVTGTIFGSLTAADSLLLNGQNGAFYLSRANHTGNLPDAALIGTYGSAVNMNNAGNAFTGAFTGNLTGNASTASDANLLDGLDSSAFALAGHTHSLASLTGTLQDAQLSGTYSGALDFSNAGNSFTGNGAGITNVNALTLLGGDWANPGAIGATTANSGAFTSLSSSGLASLNSLSVAAGATIDGNTSLNTTSGNLTIGNAGLVTVNAAPSGITNAVTVNTTGIGSTTGSIVQSQGLQVFGTSNPLATRVASLRGSINDAGSTTAGREVRGTQGTAFLTGNQSTTGANAGYFGAQYAGGSDLNPTMTGVSADAEITVAPTNAPTGLNQLIGGRFGANGDNAGAATALGTVSTALNTVARAGSNTGSLAWAAGSSTSNVGVFGTANATLVQLQTAQATLIGTGTSVGVYAYNPTAGATQFALYADGNSHVQGNLTVTGTITGSISGTAGNSLQLLGATWAAPGAIGSGTPNTGAFTTLSSTGLATLDSLTVTNAVSAASFTGSGAGLTSVNAAQFGGLATTDFMRSTGAVNESINGNKTFLGSVFVGDTAGATGLLNVTDGTVTTLALNGSTGSLTASGTVSAANVNATSVTLGGGNLNLATGDITNGGSASLTSATVSGAVVAGSVAANPGNSTANITNVPHWIEVPIPAFVGAGTNEVVNLIQLPAGAVVHATKVKHSTAYNGGGNTSFTIDVGVVGGLTDLLAGSTNLTAAPADNLFDIDGTVASYNHGSTVQIVVQATADVTTGGTGGAGTVWLLVSIAD